MLHFDAHGATLITALRKIAWPDAAVFTDKLTGVCAMLANETELNERPWELVENCLSTVREGLNEGFRFNNPNERDRCGCGESFRV
jgi:hypothetical protein